MKRNPDKKMRGNYFTRHWRLYVMLVPAFAFFALFCYYPMFGLQIAFKDWNPNLGLWGSHWAVDENGALDLFKYFKVLFDDKEVLGKLLNTLRLSSLRLVTSFPVPIVMVILLNEMRLKYFKRTVQTLTYLPHFISWITIAGILFSFTATGSSLQNVLTKVFGREIHFFSDSNLFLGTLLVSDIWKEAGWGTIIYLAAIGNIDPSLEEAAQIDGAGRWKRIVHIILPGILPALSINLIFACSNLIYGGFDQVFNMYNSAVYAKGDILETYLYRIGVSQGNYSLSTALGFFNSLVALTLMLIANKIVKKIGGTGIW